MGKLSSSDEGESYMQRIIVKNISTSTYINAMSINKTFGFCEESHFVSMNINDSPEICILVVEDNQINQKIARIFLEDAGYKVDIAANGKEAISHANKKQYDLILMDIGLPDIDGIEVTKHIRKIKNSPHVPIIALTASGEDYREKCLDAGMNDFILKPIMKDALHKAISKYLEK